MSVTKHILISYITDKDLDNEVREYENIINFIGSYFREKDYHYVIAREPIISEKLKNSIPKSKVKEKIDNRQTSIDDIRNNLYINQASLIEIEKLETEINALQQLLEE